MLYGSLIALFLVGLVLIAVLPEQILGFPSGYSVFIALASGWFLVMMRFIPRCPNCDLGYFSVLEIKRFPVIAKSSVSHHCYGCGKELK